PAPVPDYFRAAVNDAAFARRAFSDALARLHDNWRAWTSLKCPDGWVESQSFPDDFWFCRRYRQEGSAIFPSDSMGHYDWRARSSDTEPPAPAAAVVRTCNLLPRPGHPAFLLALGPPARVLTLAEKAAAADPKDSLHVGRHGAALYRAGEH